MDPRIARRNGSCGFDPPDDFREWVVRLHGCGPETVRHGTPGEDELFPSEMREDTLDSYLTWRSELWNGEGPEPI